MQLFWRKGYESTSLNDLLRETGLSKSSLYQTFGSKHLLFEQSIDRYRQCLVKDLKAMLNNARSGRQFIEDMFYSVADEVKGKNARRGCLVMNTASEFAQSDLVIAGLVKQGTRGFYDVFETAVRRTQSEGEIPANEDTRALAIYLVTAMSGLKTQVKAGASAADIISTAKIILSTLF
ncbi:MAG: TetR/AcrR family transcriptional regulator [Gammaproteobacteria bacterium]|nr:TetR/AcrR family transcriptional regulator [Gammaproteobacteria bacterium]